ncbi:MAG: flagellar biosynthesis anti-sigma factor FlgM [Deltaproteobacteria bacterium]|nr:flagellar biosynthesis anti-sigma factor FlgM [Deltaproteobacteria bacterium]
MNGDTPSDTKPGRRRGLTDLTLGWLAERFRKAESIKEKIESGSYRVDTERVAASILNVDEQAKEK